MTNQEYARRNQPNGILAVPYPRPMRDDVFCLACDWDAYKSQKKSRLVEGSQMSNISLAQPRTERNSGGNAS